MASCYFPEKIDAFSREKTTPPVDIDGFRSVIEGIDAQLKVIIDARKPRPLFVLIAGESGTGRTAAAKYVLDQFVRLAGIDPARFILPRVEMHHDPKTLLGSWLETLVVDATDAQLIEGDLAEDTLKTIDTAGETFRAKYALLIQRWVKAMNRKAFFGVLLENVLDAQYISSAKTIFQAVPAPCVFTVVQPQEDAPKNDVVRENARKVREAFNAIPDDLRMLVELSALTGEDVALFASRYWAATGNAGVPPFEEKGITAVFGDKRRKIGTARTLLGRLHNIKIETDLAGPPWGEKTLARIMPNVLLGDE